MSAAAAFARILPCDVAVAAGVPCDDDDALFASERQAVLHAVAARRREFTAGRLCARAALKKLGTAAVAIPTLRRAPLWPAGVVGSISHVDTCVVAAVARSADYRALGVDVELDVPLCDKVWSLVCTAREIACLLMLPAGERGRCAKLLFSVKECFYKCQDACVQTTLDFVDIEVTLLAEDSFLAVASESRALGRWSRVGGHVFTAIAPQRAKNGTPVRLTQRG